MSIFKCKMCGGTLEIQPGETVAECEYCGTKQTLPKLDDGRKANLFDRANHFRRNNEFDKAAGIYEQILNEDHTDAETYWSLVLCRYGIEYVEDPATHKRVPTVNRAQFTSIFDDDNYKSALNYADSYQRSIYEDEAKAINEIQKGILAISQKEEPFDVFICYKETDNSGRRTPDSVLATDLYHQLTQEGFKVFFSRITLEDKLGTAYEPYIFAALNSAKVMVVLGTKPEYFNAVWVKNEWSRYLALIKSGAKKLLIPAYKDMDPYDLPEEFSHLQAQDMSKLGFMQDLIRGVKKILAEDAPKPTAKETVVVNQAPVAGIAPLLKRAFMFLEDGDWKSANEYCEKVLDQDPENAQAYLGKLMAELKVRKQSALKDCGYTFEGYNNYQKILRFADQALCEELKGYIRHIKERNEHDRLERLYSDAADRKAQAKSEEDYKKAARNFAEIPGYRDADQQQKDCLQLAENARKDAIYEHAMAAAGSHVIEDLEDAVKQLQSISRWRDADEKLAECQQKIEKLKAEAEAERLEKARKAELEKKAAEERAKKIKKIASIAIPAIAVCIAIVVVINTVIIPNNEYKKAVALMDAGQYKEAIAAFEALDGHKDSEEKIADCETAILDEKYDAAVALMDAGQYSEAITAFKVLGTHRDSAQKVADCTTAILDREYDEAVALMDAGKYEAAISAFEKLNGYKDSDTQIENCKYNRAISLLDTKEYQLAYDVLMELGDYKNSVEILGDIKIVYTKEVTTDSDGKKTTYDYSYDAAGNLVNKVSTYSDGEKGTIDNSYDAAGNLVKQVTTFRDGQKTTYDYSYDAAGNRVKEVTTFSDGNIKTYDYSYDAAGNLVKEVYIAKDGDKITHDNSYDAAGNLVNKVTTSSDGKKTTYDYSYDAAGNLVNKVYTSSDGKKTTYDNSYDAAGNLVKQVTTSSSGSKEIYERSNPVFFYMPEE